MERPAPKDAAGDRGGGDGRGSELAALFTELVALQVELWEGLDARLKREDALSVATYNALRVIDDTASCRVQDLARTLALTVGGTSKVVDRIERAGLCRRVPNPDDRRSSIIELTAEGERQLERSRAIAADELEQRIGRTLPAERIAALTADVRAMRQAQE